MFMCSPQKDGIPLEPEPSVHTLTRESRAPVAKLRLSGVQEHAQITLVCAFITLPSSLNGCPSAFGCIQSSNVPPCVSKRGAPLQKTQFPRLL